MQAMTTRGGLAQRKTVLITGATSGIGRHAALHLAERGWRVFATGRRTDALIALAAESGGKVETLELDVTDGNSIARASADIDVCTSGYGLDVLINNAGYGAAGPTELITDSDLRAQYETNVFGAMAMIRAFVPAMRRRGHGRVINVSSLGGRFTLPLLGAYNSTKYALESLSDALRVELRPFGVRVILIEPGTIHTGFADRSMLEATKYVNDASSPYAGVLAKSGDLRRLSDRTAVGPACVSRAIERAMTARHPRARYVAPLRMGLGMALLRALPTFVSDAIVGTLTGFSSKNLKALPEPARAASAVPCAPEGRLH